MKLSQIAAGQTAIVTKVHGHGSFRSRMKELRLIGGAALVVTAVDDERITLVHGGQQLSLPTSEAEFIEVTLDASQRHTIEVALIGNPNCGKSELCAKLRQHFATSDNDNFDVKIVDFKGVNSIMGESKSATEIREYICNSMPDIIVNVVDATDLDRNLYLSTELIAMSRRMIVALTKVDKMEAEGYRLDHRQLGKMIGVPFVPTSSITGEGIDLLAQTIISVTSDSHTDVRHIHIPYSRDIETALNSVKEIIKGSPSLPLHFAPRYMAVRMLEHDSSIEGLLSTTADYDRIVSARDRAVERFRQQNHRDIGEAIVSERYGFVAGALKETMTVGAGSKSRHEAAKILDAITTNKLFGIPIFIGVMCLMFWATFQIGAYPAGWIENGVAWLSETVGNAMHDGMLKSLLCDGIISGVGGVLVFLPNILILYFFISFMEDSGYMARAAFIMDKLMHRIGLHGKSFIPLIMGFGCNVPAIMSTKNIESRSSRIITVLIIPFMSCSARLPLYVFLTSMFFKGHEVAAIMSIYVLGVIVAIFTAKLLRRFHFHHDEVPYVMELPPYRLPGSNSILRHMWGNAAEYLKKIGGVILLASIIVWGLNYFPVGAEDSYLRMFGKAITPVMQPLGFTWQATVSALAGIPAKEIVVSTLAVLSQSGESLFVAPEIASSLAFMVFISLSFPCIATLTSIIRQTKSWRYGLFSMVYNIGIAWIIAFLVFNVAVWII
ncbi:MAG: ferrous iron transport protein B [Muribaculaceae bacterium]|nr:ferrous iron transport protein B [Muribaculaceae bacterium]